MKWAYKYRLEQGSFHKDQMDLLPSNTSLTLEHLHLYFTEKPVCFEQDLMASAGTI